ncbi:unnamed protein product [Protopolystoma xenopodis]|uniref:Uncharacterized protein n=1 Tax=Protopolystoma xenopodis TaxID=117903 RepID=A0A448XNM7_9PLAT|nr:unnamed protein product [Protopolystoma xenopodis]
MPSHIETIPVMPTSKQDLKHSLPFVVKLQSQRMIQQEVCESYLSEELHDHLINQEAPLDTKQCSKRVFKGELNKKMVLIEGDCEDDINESYEDNDGTEADKCWPSLAHSLGAILAQAVYCLTGGFSVPTLAGNGGASLALIDRLLQPIICRKTTDAASFETGSSEKPHSHTTYSSETCLNEPHSSSDIPEASRPDSVSRIPMTERLVDPSFRHSCLAKASYALWTSSLSTFYSNVQRHHALSTLGPSNGCQISGPVWWATESKKGSGTSTSSSSASLAMTNSINKLGVCDDVEKQKNKEIGSNSKPDETKDEKKICSSTVDADERNDPANYKKKQNKKKDIESEESYRNRVSLFDI